MRGPGAGQALGSGCAQAAARPVHGRGRGPRVERSRQAAREAARRKRARRDRLIATVSTIVVLGALVTAIVTSKGWPTVRATFFSWESLQASFPEILQGFWLDIRLFVAVEIIVLIVGLFIALARTSIVPALAPLRLVAVVWVDVFRGVPTILVVYLVGFGVPTLELTGVPDNPVLLGGAALALSYSAYVAEVYRAGIDSVHNDQRAAALAVGLTGRQALRFVVLPQAVRRVVPPLLNDFISLQKDVALVSILGPLEAFRVAQIEASSNFEYTPLVAAALLYLCDDPARPPRRPDAARAMTAVLECQGVTKAYGEHRVLRGIDLVVEEHKAVALIGASGSGKSTLLRCIDLLEEIDDGDVLLDGEVITDPLGEAGRRPAPARDGLPGVQPVPAPDRAGEHHARAGAGARPAARGGGGAGAHAAGPVRVGRP